MADDKSHNDDTDADISFEDEGESSSSFGTPEVSKLKEKLKACQKERQEYLDGWQRARADYANYKQGEHERKEAAARAAKEEIFRELMEVVDSFEMAFANTQAWEQVDKAWRSGVESIYTQLQQLLRRHNLESISDTGVQFDPAIHEAMSTIVTDDPSYDDTVAEIVKTGYVMNERVIRPAQVHVYTYQSNE